MNSPTRRRDGGDDLPDEARALLRKAARPAPPTAVDRAAMAAMAARIAAAPVSSGPSLPRGVWSRLAGIGAGKGVGIAGLILAIGGATWLGVRLLGAGDPGQIATTPAPAEGSAKTMAPPPPAAPAATAGTPANEVPGASANAGGTAMPGAPRTAEASGGPPARESAAHGIGGVPTGARRSPGAVSTPPGRRAAAASPLPVAAAAPVAPAPLITCPAGAATPGDRAAEAPILAAAARSLAQSPAVTLACIQELSRIGGPFQLRDEHAFLGFEASRRLGREADARRFAEALLRASPGSAYAARARAYLR